MDVESQAGRRMGRPYRAGEVIFKKGERADCLFVVQEGRVELLLANDLGEEERLTVVTSGQLFGETGLFLAERQRIAEARALDDARVLTIDDKTVISRMHQDPGLSFRVIRHMAQRISDLDQERAEWISMKRAWSAASSSVTPANDYDGSSSVGGSPSNGMLGKERPARNVYDFSVGYQVLMVEDDSDFHRLAACWLEQAEIPGSDHPLRPNCCAVTWVVSLEEALDRLAVDKYDLVLLDLNLPDSQGMASFQRVFERAPDTPVVVVSGMDNEDQAVNAIRIGAQDYLIKDQITRARFVQSVRYALARRRFLRDTHGESSDSCWQGMRGVNALLEWGRRNLLTWFERMKERLFGSAAWI